MFKLVMKKNDKGFTLIELIIVIAVLAVIAALVVPRYLNFLDEAKAKAVISDKAMITSAVELCLVYDPDGKSLLTQYVTEKVIDESEPLIPKYLKTAPIDPNGDPYIMKISTISAGNYDIEVMQSGD